MRKKNDYDCTNTELGFHSDTDTGEKRSQCKNEQTAQVALCVLAVESV